MHSELENSRSAELEDMAGEFVAGTPAAGDHMLDRCVRVGVRGTRQTEVRWVVEGATT
jgi:hypothetical protein